MAVLRFGGRDLPLEEHESVLDCLLRHQQHIPYACKAGMCQACLVKAVDCDATEESRKWIKPALQARGYTLACQWVPRDDVAARLPTLEEFAVPVRLRSLDALTGSVLRLRLEVLDPAMMFPYRPGQYLSLINPEGIARSYSIANDYEAEGFIELHVSRTSHGVFTAWLFSRARPGDLLHIRGPAGDCFYEREEEEAYPLLLAGTGSGLAPLYGILRQALAREHRGEVTLVHGGRSRDQLYHIEELAALEETHANFRYVPVVREHGAGGDPRLSAGDAMETALRQVEPGGFGRCRFYLCGAPDFVHGLRRKLFLKGARSEHIRADPFTERTVVIP